MRDEEIKRFLADIARAVENQTAAQRITGRQVAALVDEQAETKASIAVALSRRERTDGIGASVELPVLGKYSWTREEVKKKAQRWIGYALLAFAGWLARHL